MNDRSIFCRGGCGKTRAAIEDFSKLARSPFFKFRFPLKYKLRKARATLPEWEGYGNEGKSKLLLRRLREAWSLLVNTRGLVSLRD